MARRCVVVCSVVLVSLVTGVSVASANTYCVSDPGCPSGGTVEPDLQTALNDANAHAGADTVRIGPGTFSAGAGFNEKNDSSPITIVGAGRGSTTLVATNANARVLDLAQDTNATVSDLAITMPPSGGVGVNVPQHIARVDISGGSGAAYGLRTQNTTVDDVTITLPLTSSTTGLYRPNGTLTANRLAITAANAIDGFGTSDSYTGLRIVASGIGINLGSKGSSFTIDDAQIRMTGSGTGLVWTAIFGSGPANLTARFLTIAGDGTPGSVGLASTASSTNGSAANVTVSNSIIQGFAHPLRCDAASGTTATLTMRYSAFSVAGFNGSCAGSIDTTTGNTAANANLLTAANGDLLPPFNSPVIDAGDPAFAPPPALDLAGNPRVVGARADMGAFEYQRLPPTAVASVSPSKVGVDVPATFSSDGSTDPDLGDTLTYAWAFDDGTTATGASPQHAFHQAGTHTASVTVTDPTGLTAKASTQLIVTTAPVTPPAGGATAPVITNLSETATRWRLGNGLAQLTALKGRAPIGTTFAFTLDKPALVTLDFIQSASGRRVGGKCTQPTKRNAHNRKCLRSTSVGKLYFNAHAGTNRVHFEGRLDTRRRLSRGRYTMLTTATAANGPASVPQALSFTIVG